MNASASLLVNLTSQLLTPAEREVVLGDLAEARAGVLHSLRQVLELGIRRHIALWKSWQPWLTGPGLALPASFLLMGVSLSVSQAGLQLADPGSGATAGLIRLVTQACLLLGWSWTAGYVVGNLSRRTLWASIAICAGPCIDCLSKFHLDSLSPLCLLWFLIPAGLGVRQGLRRTRVTLSGALAITAVLTLAMFLAWRGDAPRWWTPPWWLVDAVMSWPSLYLVAKARKPCLDL